MGHGASTVKDLADILNSGVTPGGDSFSFSSYGLIASGSDGALTIASNDQNFTKLEVAKLIKNYINYNLINNEFSKDKDQRNYEVSYKKIASLGFKRKFSLEDGISDLIKVCKILKEESIFRNF